MESEFNLIYEPWIMVRCGDKVSEVSLLDALVNAHEYTALAGEMPTQDFAMLRLLLAVLHAALQDMEVEYEYEDDIPINKWEELWSAGKFPKDIVFEYLTKWKDRFYLFDEKYPFYQVADVKEFTELTAAKLNGTLSESGHKIRLFPQIAGEIKESLSYSEAARWLISFNAWDDIMTCKKAVYHDKKCYEKGRKYGWLGTLGNIYAVGDNLFETLMLNLVFDTEDVTESPVWAIDKPLSCSTTLGKMYGIAKPNNQAELLTLLGRYMLLNKDDTTKQVTSIKVTKKLLVSQNDLLLEKMTVWNINKNSSEYYPKKHSSSIQVWREFSSIIPKALDEKHKPGICEWISKFIDHNQPLNGKIISFATCGVEYDSVGGSIVNSFSDSITVHSSLLSELGKAWNDKISEEIKACGDVARYLDTLQKELIISKSAVPDKLDILNKQCEKVKQEFYFRIDVHVRKWIESIDPSDENITKKEKCNELRETVAQIARKYALELADSAGQSAIIGRYGNNIFGITKSEKEKTVHYSSPEALNKFYGKMKNKYLEGGDKNAK